MNKNGIVIKPGQVWGSEKYPYDVTAIAPHSNGWVCHATENYYFNFPPNAICFGTLLKSHDGADLEAARADGWLIWVEGMDALDMSKVDEFEIVDGSYWIQHWTTNPLLIDRTYRYKLKTEEPEPRCNCGGVFFVANGLRHDIIKHTCHKHTEDSP